MKISQIVGLFCMFIVIVVGSILFFGSWTTIPAGYSGVVLRMGAVTGQVMDSGFNFKTPWITEVVEIENRVQKEQVETEGASKDLQTIKAEIAANLRPDTAAIARLYKEVGPEYLNRIVAPAMQESIKATVAQYTAEELITQRESVREGIRALLSTKMQPHGIIIEDLNIVDFDFSASFNESIEAKVTAEQNALAAKNKLAQVEFEAQQRVAEARGKAEAMQVEANALASNPAILQLRALEKWNGILPSVTGGAIPFIDIDAISKK